MSRERRDRRDRRIRFAIAAVVLVSIGLALAVSAARPVAYVVAPIGGAVLTIMAAGFGRGWAVLGVWHDAWHPDGVERRLLGVATSDDGAQRLAQDAARRPGLAAAGICVQPEVVGVLGTAETWSLWRRGRRARLDDVPGPTVWFVTDAQDPLVLRPGESALGFALSARSAELVVHARQAESLRDPAAVHAVELRIGADLWPDGVAVELRPVRPLGRGDATA